MQSESPNDHKTRRILALTTQLGQTSNAQERWTEDEMVETILGLSQYYGLLTPDEKTVIQDQGDKATLRKLIVSEFANVSQV